MAPQAPVVVAGAGIGGLALALALARRGIQVRVLERTPAVTEIGAGLQLSPNACRVLAQLGLDPVVDCAAMEPAWLHMHDGRSGAAIVSLPLGTARQRWGVPYCLVHRADLQGALHGAAVAAGAEITLGCEVAGFRQQEDGDIAVETTTGTVHAPALIGADGLGSAVRRALGDATAPAASAMAGWRTLIPMVCRPRGIAADAVSLWLGAGGHAVAYPLRGGAVLNVVACIPVHGRAAARQNADPATLERFFRRWAPAARSLIEAGETWTAWPLLDRVPGYLPGRGAAALIGDAAHPALPHLAQGAAMAIEDAAVMAARLAATPDDPAGAMRRAERSRMARVARIQREARQNGRIYTLGPLPAAARDLALRAIGPGRLMRRLDWLYGWGR